MIYFREISSKKINIISLKPFTMAYNLYVRMLLNARRDIGMN
jgi:hypothetical protein